MVKNPISILLLATLPDNGIKSLGSKSLLKIKNKTILEHQLENIRSAFKNTVYDITIVCAFDCNRVSKAIGGLDYDMPIQIIKQKQDNLNFAGAFIDGLSYIKYDRVLSINYGNLFTKAAIQHIIANKDENIIGVAKNHRHNDNIMTGCYMNNNIIENIFFNLGEHKYLDINLWSSSIIKYIKQNLSIDQYKNKFMFEIINTMINYGYIFKPSLLDTKECLFIDSINMLNKGKRIYNNGKYTNKKTKY